MNTFADVIKTAYDHKYSDIHLKGGLGIYHRKGGRILRNVDLDIPPDKIEEVIQTTLDDRCRRSLAKHRKIDYSLQVLPEIRARGNAFYQRKALCGIYRIIPTKVPSIKDTGLPPILRDFALRPRGLVIVAGPAGSGKTTTAAAMINEINISVRRHIVTIEDPVEFIFVDDKSVITQREIGTNSLSFQMGLKGSLRQDPDVVFIGEMRDLETVSTAITMAETGHLVISTIQTIGACEVIDRIVNMFPPQQQEQIRTQLSLNTQGIVSQMLLPKGENANEMVAAIEILNPTFALRALIRKGEVVKIKGALETSVRDHCMPGKMAVEELFKKKLINEATKAMALDYMK
ncbi:MAG: PilT/PilU family type 4a pilus ATPase [Candidatus Riflebacteria bacterium]|nr:PilT/PilU family type 4a pilus ATPase [Candidatus Riflebacteria bacterium]